MLLKRIYSKNIQKSLTSSVIGKCEKSSRRCRYTSTKRAQNRKAKKTQLLVDLYNNQYDIFLQSWLECKVVQSPWRFHKLHPHKYSVISFSSIHPREMKNIFIHKNPHHRMSIVVLYFINNGFKIGERKEPCITLASIKWLKDKQLLVFNCSTLDK